MNFCQESLRLTKQATGSLDPVLDRMDTARVWDGQVYLQEIALHLFCLKHHQVMRGRAGVLEDA